ncbi:MAG TPA: amidohydrolase family protein, partial [Saprospiraceae bacterium]|nr:amidohydrolase family protein [Saprospiraceae bacterium]
MRSIFFLAFIFLFPPDLSAQLRYLHCGRLITMAGGNAVAQEEMTLIVQADTVLRVEKGYRPAPAGAELIDLKNKTVLPGLIDCHVHFEFEQSRSSYNEKYTMNDADIAFRAEVYAERTLLAGFTTVRDLGGKGINISLRNAIN